MLLYADDIKADFCSGDHYKKSTGCVVDSDENCEQLDDPCDKLIKTGYERQVFLVMASMRTLSRFLHWTWSTFNQAHLDLTGMLTTWVAKFTVPDKKPTWKNTVGVFGSVVGMISVLGFLIGPFLGPAAGLTVGAAAAVLFGVGSILNGAITFSNANGEETDEPIFEALAPSEDSMKKFIDLNQDDLEGQFVSKYRGLALSIIL